MLQAGGQRLAFLESLLHLRSKTFNAHGNNLTAVQRSAKNPHSDLRINHRRRKVEHHTRYPRLPGRLPWQTTLSPLCFLCCPLFKIPLTYVRNDFSLVELLQTMQKVFVVHRLANDRVEVIDAFVVRGVIKGHPTLA